MCDVAKIRRQSEDVRSNEREYHRQYLMRPEVIKRERARSRPRKANLSPEQRESKKKQALEYYHRRKAAGHQRSKKSSEAERKRGQQRRANMSLEEMARRREYYRVYGQKRRSSPREKLNRRISSQIRQNLAQKSVSKRGRSWELLVGYTAAELYTHIERQFRRGMSWDNMSEWHIDHIIPLSSFLFDDATGPDFAAAWSLTNLRPLWSGENLQKGYRRTLLL